MKKTLLLLLAFTLSTAIMAQSQSYQLKVYCNNEIAEEVERYCDERILERGLGDAMLDAAVGAAKGITSGYVVSVVDFGVNAVANLVTRKARMKAEWENIVANENKNHTALQTIAAVNNFYNAPSTEGAMDPKGMVFDGLSCMKILDEDDTVFYISLHVDRQKINRIVEHSKFELVLDTLIINPLRSGLPNSDFETSFSFADRRNYSMTVDIAIHSSWMDQLPQMQSNQLLGQFRLQIPVTEKEIDKEGYLHYIRGDNENPRYLVTGDCFVVPRSYSGYRDSDGNYHEVWGTGEYSVGIDMTETCTVTDTYRKNWRKNMRDRKKWARKDFHLIARTWETVSSQQWDEVAQSWVLTVLKAPADVLTKEIIDKMDLGSKTKGNSEQNK